MYSYVCMYEREALHVCTTLHTVCAHPFPPRLLFVTSTPLRTVRATTTTTRTSAAHDDDAPPAPPPVCCHYSTYIIALLLIVILCKGQSRIDQTQNGPHKATHARARAGGQGEGTS